MSNRTIPAVDQALVPRHGVSRLGQPLSYNRAPAPDLAPWIGWLYATVVDAPADYRLECALFNDSALIRIQLRGEWRAETRDGPREYGRSALLFGPQSRCMKIGVTGSFISVGISLKPGAGHAVLGVSAADFVDRLVPVDELGLPGEAVLGALDPDAEPEQWLQVLEGFIRRVADQNHAREPDPLAARFEAIALTNPTMPVAEAARRCGVDQRKLERAVRRDFGMAPKQVLRRARALDMASHLRGVADQAEAEELALRYYDQSHLIREFDELFGMSPSQFVAAPLPILTLALESRQARRLEAMDRLAPGAARPWQ